MSAVPAEGGGGTLETPDRLTGGDGSVAFAQPSLLAPHAKRLPPPPLDLEFAPHILPRRPFVDQGSRTQRRRARAAGKVPAGQQAIYGESNGKPVNVATSQDMQDKLSWRKGRLVFKGEPLGGVIEEFSRYTSTKIIIPGKKMRLMKVGGVFKVGDTVAMLDALQEGFGIHAKYVSDDIVYLVFEDDQ